MDKVKATAVANFAHSLSLAYDAWDKSMVGWSSLYDKKLELKEELEKQIPEISYVTEFWRIVGTGSDWESRLLEAIQSLHTGTPCQSCGKTKVKWPMRNCDACIAEKKTKLEATKEQRKALRKRKRVKTKPKSITKWKLAATQRS